MSSGIYRVGQKVTPRDNSGWGAIYVGKGESRKPDRALPEHGRVYTVSGFSTHQDGTPSITLREYPGDWNFEKSAFRPVVDESRRYCVSFTTPVPDLVS